MPRQRGPPDGRGMGSRSMSLRDMNDLSKIQEAVNSQKNAPWYIMHPESRFMTGWDLFTGVALIFTALITPYELAFLEPELNALFVVNRLIDLTFVIDMVFQFLTNWMCIVRMPQFAFRPHFVECTPEIASRNARPCLLAFSR